MSLIKCPECGQEVSSKAEICPHCGVKIAGNIKRCPICQRTMLMDARECPHCHTRLEVAADIQLEPGAEGEKTTPSNTETRQYDTSSSQQIPAIIPPVTTPVNVNVNEEHDAKSELPAQDEGNMPDAKQKKGQPWYLLLFIIVVVALGGYLYWDNYQQRRYSEERAFELLRECNDPLNFEDFIARYPNSEHLEEVRAMLKELQKEDAVWEVVASSNNVEDYRNFMQAHPRSPFVKVAIHKIDSLDWREADRKGTSAAYDAYILNHDAGEYISEAYEARDAARSREERARRDSIAAAQAVDTVEAAPEPVGIDELIGAE